MTAFLLHLGRVLYSVLLIKIFFVILAITLIFKR
jgi:hypothetical protein